ncbi:MAG TPA: hypothetical protein VIL66_01515 [Bacillota bacterium]
MHLDGVRQVRLVKDKPKSLINRTENRNLRRRICESAVLELGSPDLRETGIYHLQIIKNPNQFGKHQINDSKVETLRSMVEKMIFKQALAGSEAEEEYWNATATSQRVIELAKTLAIDDPDQAYQMKTGFIKGFHDAQELYGKALPQVCTDTLRLTTEAFDSWIIKVKNKE